MNIADLVSGAEHRLFRKKTVLGEANGGGGVKRDTNRDGEGREGRRGDGGGGGEGGKEEGEDVESDESDVPAEDEDTIDIMAAGASSMEANEVVDLEYAHDLQNEYVQWFPVALRPGLERKLQGPSATKRNVLEREQKHNLSKRHNASFNATSTSEGGGGETKGGGGEGRAGGTEGEEADGDQMGDGQPFLLLRLQLKLPQQKFSRRALEERAGTFKEDVEEESLGIFERYRVMKGYAVMIEGTLATICGRAERAKNLFAWTDPIKARLVAKIMGALTVMMIVVPTRFIFLFVGLFLFTEEFRSPGTGKKKMLHFLSTLPTDPELDEAFAGLRKIRRTKMLTKIEERFNPERLLCVKRPASLLGTCTVGGGVGVGGTAAVGSNLGDDEDIQWGLKGGDDGGGGGGRTQRSMVAWAHAEVKVGDDFHWFIPKGWLRIQLKHGGPWKMYYAALEKPATFSMWPSKDSALKGKSPVRLQVVGGNCYVQAGSVKHKLLSDHDLAGDDRVFELSIQKTTGEEMKTVRIACSTADRKIDWVAALGAIRATVVKVEIIHARNLICRKLIESQKNNAYCRVSIGSMERTTTTERRTNDPNWSNNGNGQIQKFLMPRLSEAQNDDILICIKSDDFGATRDDDLGAVRIKLTSDRTHLGDRWIHHKTKDTIELKPTWLELEPFGNMTGKWKGRAPGQYGQVHVAVIIQLNTKAVQVHKSREDVRREGKEDDKEMQ